MSQTTFDFSTLTVDQFDAQFRAEIEQDYDKLAEGLARVVTGIKGYDKPITLETFTSLKYWQYKAIMEGFRAALRTHPIPDLPEGVTYDIQNMLARDVVTLTKAMTRANTRGMIDVLVRVVTDCPAAWGKANKPATWKKRLYYGELLAVVSAIITDANDTEKNGSADSIFG